MGVALNATLPSQDQATWAIWAAIKKIPVKPKQITAGVEICVQCLVRWKI